MAKKIKQKEKSGGLPLWLGTFGDLMSLLLTFFILLLSMATFDAKKLIEAEASIQGALSILPGGIKIEPSVNRITLPGDITIPPEYADELRLIEQSIIDFNEMPNVSNGAASILGDGINGFIITLPANVVFDKNFKINEDSKLFLKRVSQIFAKMPQNTQIEVLGKSNISTSQINLDRASNIALAVSRELFDLNIEGSRISTIGKEDKSVNTDTINIRFYAKNMPIKTKGILDN
ncbi:flagellar motor protein MotB [Helicobacter sp. MIT 14-3879]|uniref:flagellar motor protein MotB n=1 Tax=Helicobacter sp. MIT 14-3879 TaxID=2040649 RepID=UPI000E1F88F7|nr:flagellar motor protein MotB [Helicobacter sp. MIT 14-3879]RDU61706.1 flagellar motor protein MotB [Helicobacter sp. MIT 14-3879]